MSSPSIESENAASTAPLSQSPPPRSENPSDIADDPLGGGGGGGGAQHGGQRAAEQLLPLPSVDDATPLPDAQGSGSIGTGLPNDKTLPASSTTAQRPPGPSLLTQALATARGIPRQTQPSQSLNTSQEGAGSGARTSVRQDETQLERGPPNKATASTTSDKARDTDTPTQHGDKNSLEPHPALPISFNMAASTATPPNVPIPGRDAASVPSSFNNSVLTDVRDMLFEQRGTSGRLLRRSSISLDVDRTVSAFDKPKGGAYSTSPEQSTTPTKTSYLTGDIPFTAPQALETPRNDMIPRYRPPPPDHRYTLGPEKTEKIWSIGSGEGAEEDGLVEKSVAEAMAGVEHNTRSRKASYSLRFFKEGLPPDDKVRRRGDAKSSNKEKLPSTLEEGQTQGQADEQGQPGTPKHIEQPPSSHGETSIDPSGASSSKDLAKDQAGYFSIDKTNAANQKAPSSSRTPPLSLAEHEDTKQPESLSSESRVGSAQAPIAEAQSVEGRRESGDSTEVGESHDDADADESGEEKISSAIFVPHQEAGDSRAHKREPIDIVGGTGQRPRSLSQDEAHPWLVKADEPEPDIDEREEPAGRLSRYRSRESLVSSRGELASEISEDLVVEGEHEINNHLVQALARSGIQTFDDSQESHHTHQPLEAIELIPYKHQVGGHTTLWRFSRRAVCKQLNNRENEFYEIIERYHRDLLSFLPRYVICVSGHSPHALVLFLANVRYLGTSVFSM